jgi:hypothetical protein
MTLTYTETRVKGRNIKVPSTQINNRTVMVTNTWLKMAAVQDEELVEGEVVDNPEVFIGALKKGILKADIFTFAQHLPDITPKHRYYFEWDNVAVIPITTFKDWWMKQSHSLRRDVKRAEKRGVVVRVVEFNDEFVRGIMEIYNETPLRQGRPFWHYRKDFDSVRMETSTYLERSEFLGAYCGDELIGFLKFVRVGRLARLMFIISKMVHYDKRPSNALIAKAVELCVQRECSHLTYGNFAYDNDASTSLVAFKRRNGFEQLDFPRYFVPLTMKGKLCLKLKCHHGIKGLIPIKLLNLARGARKEVCEAFRRKLKSTAEAERVPPRRGSSQTKQTNHIAGDAC